jgi:F1F0 ATPase subunit 2
MQIDLSALLIGFGAGMALGAFYFLGLWWTIRKLAAVRNPVLWTTVSFLIRSAMVLAGFYVLLQGGSGNLLVCLAGFTLMRLWLVRRLSPAAAKVLRPGH